jgi:predicted TIM-barrel enzyme
LSNTLVYLWAFAHPIHSRIMPKSLKELKELGFCGVQNFPTVGLIDGTFRVNLEETGIGYDNEVKVIREVHKLDLLTTPYVFSTEEAEKMKGTDSTHG